MSTSETSVVQSNAGYWDHVVKDWNEQNRDALWRAHSDAVNALILARWLPAGPLHRVLKTDLFDEAVAEGLYPSLQDCAQNITGIDLSPEVVDAAHSRYPRLEGVTADVLHLPFSDGEFDAVISLSTLDHFDSPDKICVALTELHRVLAPQGILIITLDNGFNPAVALRNALPHGALRRIGLVPYMTGVTCKPKQFLQTLHSCGFDVADLVFSIHCPRAIAVICSRVVQRLGNTATWRRFLRLLAAVERFDRWPTRSLTGYYIATRAIKQ